MMPELTTEELETLLARIAKRAAKEALEEMGLAEETAAEDMREIRGLLDAWRDTKRSFRKSLTTMIGHAFAVALLAGLALYAKDWMAR
ncbi:MAG: hypothetical protein RI906_3338 [Pseudomonadota bacterium]|jgi:NifB/MoaA-like Fe-S oxidoreductase